MYRTADKLLKQLKQIIRREFNRMGIFGFDELNTPRITRETLRLFDDLGKANREKFLEVAKKSYIDAVALAVALGYTSFGGTRIDEKWLNEILGSYDFVSGYLYNSEAERKRLRLAEELATSREYQSRTRYNDSLRRSANLWWSQTMHYMILFVDRAILAAYKDCGVEYVKWNAHIDGRECKVCRERNGKIYKIDNVPPKAHRNCRCFITPIENNRQGSR